jgi:hypothetical protein
VGVFVVVIGMAVGSFVALLGRSESTPVPRLPFTWSIVTGVVGAGLGTPLWQFLRLDMPVLIAQLSGAIVALDLYMAIVVICRRR